MYTVLLCPSQALERHESANSGHVSPGSARNSDLSASIAFVKGTNLHPKFSKIMPYLFMVINMRYLT